MNQAAILAHSLSKQYTISAARRHDTLRDQVANGLHRFFLRRTGSYTGTKSFWALKDISFQIEQGETIGIIGRNGAGKSTLLKILSRIVEPTHGRAEVTGRLGSLLEVGTGFHSELTGRENLYLSGAILGMRRAEIERKFDDIVAFAEIEEFIDTPVKHYSSGMYVRLAFAVAAHLDPDILLIDEVLAVGDLGFQKKCIERTKKLRDANSTVLFVSHNMFSIKMLCSRVIYLADGEIRFDGAPEEGIALYEKESRLTTAPWAHGGTVDNLRITDIQLLDVTGRRRHIFDYGESIRIRLSYETAAEIRDPNFSVSFFRSDNIPCCNYNAALDGFAISSLSGKGAIELVTAPLKLVAGLYITNVIVRNAKHERLYTAQVGDSFHVRHPILNHHFGIFHESAEWSFTTGKQEALVAANGTNVND